MEKHEWEKKYQLNSNQNKTAVFIIRQNGFRAQTNSTDIKR